ncbi:MAG: DUF2784 domain-containing protein [Acidobacteriaceae bacterium]|nr:DUF2784 domain-containing protein [Acidobacteriaceae bacterium]
MHYLGILVLAVHLLWIVWVVFGAVITRHRPFLAVFHVLSLLWGIAVELLPVDCPLTVTEQLIEEHAGNGRYRGSFIGHYLERLVYPDIPVPVLVSAGVVVCVLNLSVYVWRYQQWRSRTAQTK